MYLSRAKKMTDIADKRVAVWDWIRKGKLSAIKIGRDYRVSEEDIKNFEEIHRTTK